jgi:hypothetical protein
MKGHGNGIHGVAMAQRSIGVGLQRIELNSAAESRAVFKRLSATCEVTSQTSLNLSLSLIIPGFDIYHPALFSPALLRERNKTWTVYLDGSL